VKGGAVSRVFKTEIQTDVHLCLERKWGAATGESGTEANFTVCGGGGRGQRKLLYWCHDAMDRSMLMESEKSEWRGGPSAKKINNAIKGRDAASNTGKKIRPGG